MAYFVIDMPLNSKGEGPETDKLKVHSVVYQVWDECFCTVFESINLLEAERKCEAMNIDELKFKKYPVLDQGFICLVDVMGNDSSIVQAARVSYGKDDTRFVDQMWEDNPKGAKDVHEHLEMEKAAIAKIAAKDRNLIRYLTSHQHTTPFEMVEIKFMVQVPMDCWRQWIRHRTANVNEYSTRYTEAIDACQTTAPDQWRLQATDNKQGSGGFVDEWSEEICGMGDSTIPQIGSEAWKDFVAKYPTPGEYLSLLEYNHHRSTSWLYKNRLKCGVAKEQARKDLPLSTYTRAYWKCDLHNIFNFLRLRMDSHAQYEIRMYANAMYEIVKQIVPVACEAFEDYVLNAKKFSAMEMNYIRKAMAGKTIAWDGDMTKREIDEFVKKVGI